MSSIRSRTTGWRWMSPIRRSIRKIPRPGASRSRSAGSTASRAQNGRIYYAVSSQQVWSVRINDDGSFGAARWELDVTGLPSANEITSIVFDPQGRMILAQRGATDRRRTTTPCSPRPARPSVVRYEREFPDDPATPGTWVETPDTYAIGVASDGLAMRPAVSRSATGSTTRPARSTAPAASTCGRRAIRCATIPTSIRRSMGRRMCTGLQGMPRTLVRPLNDPPTAVGLHRFRRQHR